MWQVQRKEGGRDGSSSYSLQTNIMIALSNDQDRSGGKRMMEMATSDTNRCDDGANRVLYLYPYNANCNEIAT